MNPTGPDSWPQVGTVTRLHVPITVGNDIRTHADLDTCAEVDLVSVDFVKEHRLNRAKFNPPLIQAVGGKSVSTYGVWNVPLTICDSRGTEKVLNRPYVAVDRDPRLEGSPVLLSNTTLVGQKIVLVPWKGYWWFETAKPSMEILTASRFAKACKNRANVFAVLKVSEDELVLPDEGGDEGVSNPNRIPPEFKDFEHVFEVQNSKIMPPRKETDHEIGLEEGGIPPHGPIYPLSQAELKVLREYLD